MASEYEEVHEAGYGINSVYEGLAAADDVSEIDHVAAIRDSINQRDPGGLYAAATRAVSQLIRMHLQNADKHLDRPGAAQDQVLRAQALYRAFDFGIEQTDSEAHSNMGRAWLSVATSIGVAGVGSADGVTADVAAFRQARNTIERLSLIHI